MNTRSILLSAILMATIQPAFAQAAPGMPRTKMSPNMQSMSMDESSSHMRMRMDCAQTGNGAQKENNGVQGMKMGKNMPCANQMAQATGVIQAMDMAKGTVTIKHQAIPSIHWPAMTMTFKADPPSLLKGVKVGEKVDFTLHPAGMNSTVTAMELAKGTGH